MCNNWGQNKWIEEHKTRFPSYFEGDIRVIEIGSADINGSIRKHFLANEYVGVDVAPASCVDIVSIAHEYKGENNSWDVVCSTNALEHDMYWEKTLKKMYDLTKSGGMLWFVACSNWEEHGTHGTSPEQSLTSTISKEWGEYYKNISMKDVSTVLKPDMFRAYHLENNLYTDIDVCFWGIK